jgi:hypothetical protein
MKIPVGVDLLPSIIKCPKVWLRELGQWLYDSTLESRTETKL